MRYLTGLFALAMCSASPALAATPDSAPRVDYVIKRGDTLFSLWQNYLTGPKALREIQRINRIGNVRAIPVGTVLKIPRRLLKDEVSAAKVETFSGEVVVKNGGKSVAVKLGDTIPEGAIVDTGRNAFVTLRLSDGSALAIPSQSSLRISWLRKVKLTGALEREIALKEGRLRAKVIPMKNPDSNFRVVTPVAASAVRGTEFRVAYNPATSFSATQVDEGNVAFAAGTIADELALPAGYGAGDEAGKPTGVIKLIEPPKLQNPGKVQSEENLHFTLTPLPGATRYHLQLARDASFLEGIGEQTAAETAFTLPSLPADSYFVRVSALDRYGLEGMADTYNFERRRNSVAGQLDGGAPGEKRLRFRWEGTADGTPQFRFRLVRKGEPNLPIVDEAGLTANLLSVSNLPPGEYLWQVASTIFVKGQAVSTWAPEQSLKLAQ